MNMIEREMGGWTKGQFPRTGNYMHTSNGRKYWPLDPKPEEVDLEVIAHHLANRCRYNGATQHPTDIDRIFFSVAEHSIYVAIQIALFGGSNTEILCGEVHDGSESYNGDLIRPLKYDPLFSRPFKTVEELNELAIARRFGVPFPYPAIVKRADEAVTAAEVEQIVPRCSDEDWEAGRLHDNAEVAPFRIQMLLPADAKRLFLKFHQGLMNGYVPMTPDEIDTFFDAPVYQRAA